MVLTVHLDAEEGEYCQQHISIIHVDSILGRVGFTSETASEECVRGEGAGCVEGIGVDYESEDTGEDEETSVEVSGG